MLTRLAADIAIYRLAVSADLRIDEHRVRYDDAVKLLVRIAKGEASLGLASPGAAEPGVDAIAATAVQPGDVFFFGGRAWPAERPMEFE